ncbi:MAG: D-alanyl-D-alanine carboxypeptidase/D-alanyl-D-alanine-endopeptidase, partial [Janthinobacterium lividum]
MQILKTVRPGRRSPRRFPLLCSMTVLVFASAAAMAQQLPPAVSAAFSRAGIPAGAIGAWVQEIGSGRMVVESNSAMPFNPASTMKLVTTDAALELLGPTYRWRTEVLAAGAQNGDVLSGDLVFKGGGDPKLVLENFWLLLRQVRAKGIREIQGDVLLDRSVFEPMINDPAAFDGDPLRPYNAAPDALLLNYETLTYQFSPDGAQGGVKVAVDPPVTGFALTPPRLTAGECGDWKGKLRPSFNG